MLWTVILYVKEIDSLLRKSVNYIFKHHSCYRAVYQTFYRLKCFIGWKKVKNGTNLIPLCVDFSATKKISSNIANIHYTATSFVWFLYYWYKRSSLYQILPTTYRCKELESLKRYQIFNYSTIPSNSNNYAWPDVEA